MVDALLKPISDSVQMYLVKLKRLQEKINPVPLSILANSLDISPVSVNEMCRKMQEQDLINYQPYKGASLTLDGDLEAVKILRRHRLWEVFLVEKLLFSYEEAHEMADILEHATTRELADRLNDYLGNPKFNPKGKEIPATDGKTRAVETCSLTALEIGESAVLLIKEGQNPINDFLKQAGCTKGKTIKVAGRTDDLILIGAKQKLISISVDLGARIEVIKTKKEEFEQVNSSKANKKDNKTERLSMNKAEITEIIKVSLDKLGIGRKGTIVSLSGKGPVKQRMMDMGLVPGSQVEVIRVAPLGDPIEINLKGYNLSLRRSEAKSVMVEAAAED